MKSVPATVKQGQRSATNVALVLLAGGLRPSPLQQALGIPPLCLPLGHSETLLAHWLSAAQSLQGCGCVVIAVSKSEDAASIHAELERQRFVGPKPMRISVVMEPATWRGPAGLLFDLIQSGRCDFPSGGVTVVAGEASCLPPENLQDAVAKLGLSVPGISVTCSRGEPAGLYVFSDAALRLIPSIGFYDIKEQLLPSLYAQGTPVQEMRIARESIRVRDRESYLRAVRATLPIDSEITGCSPGAHIAESARLAGRCLVGSGAIVGPHAIVHESIVLDEAVIGKGAVVSHSVIGPSTHIQPGEIVKRRVVGAGRVGRQRFATMRVLSEMFGLGSLLRGAQAS